MTLVSTSQLYALIDLVANFAESFFIVGGFSLMMGIKSLAWLGTGIKLVLVMSEKFGG
jgi:hypothetical protein